MLAMAKRLPPGAIRASRATSADLVRPCRSITASYASSCSCALKARHSRRVAADQGEPRQRRSSQAMTRLRAGFCADEIGIRGAIDPAKLDGDTSRDSKGANDFSSTQSMRASGRAARMSWTTGKVCTTSPSDDSLTSRIFMKSVKAENPDFDPRAGSRPKPAQIAYEAVMHRSSTVQAGVLAGDA